VVEAHELPARVSNSGVTATHGRSGSTLRKNRGSCAVRRNAQWRTYRKLRITTMKKDTNTQPEYLIESDYLIFQRIKRRFVHQTWIALSVLVYVFGSYDYTGGGILSTLLLKFSGWVSHAIPLIDQLAQVRPRPDATRVIQSLIILLAPFEMVRLVRMMRRAVDGARNKALLMKKLCGDKKTLIGRFLYVAYTVCFVSGLLAALYITVVSTAFTSPDQRDYSSHDHIFYFVVRTALGVEFSMAFIIAMFLHFCSSGFVALSCLFHEQFHSQKGK